MSESPFDRVLAALQRRGARIRLHGPRKLRATCPAHDDRAPSLSVTEAADRVLLRCFAGCRFRDVVRALGMTPRDLFDGPRARATEARTIVAVYPYTDLHGVILFEKVRYAPKSFRVRVPDGDGYRYRLDGVERVLYRWPDLLDERDVCIVESEKSVDALWRIGIPATCAPGGAGHWTEAYSRALWQACVLRVTILPDHDPAGERHAHIVATACHRYRPDPTDVGLTEEEFADADAFQPLTATVVRLADLPPSGDVADWLDAGGTAAELRRLISQAETWDSDRDAERREAARRDRRRQQNRDRVRRHRDRRRTARQAADAVTQPPEPVTHVSSEAAKQSSEAVTHVSSDRPVTQVSNLSIERSMLFVTS
jgi:DNA primase